LALGVASQAFGSQRAGVGTVVLFLGVGLLLLAGVDERAGIAAARTAPVAGPVA